jgi:hypothetical protein
MLRSFFVRVGLVWDLRGQTAKLIDCSMDLAVRLSALRQVQFQRGARQTPVGAPRNRCHHFQITTQFHHGRRVRIHCMFALCLQKQLWLIQKALTNRSCRSSPGGM